jgi:alkylation response protein AidB-like acyl-CoA dehydrogenase
MNFELGPDEEALIAAVRDALARTDTLGAARSALDGAPRVHLWKEAVRGGWTGMPGLLYGVLVLIECGRRLAPTGLLGHLTVTSVLPEPDLLEGTRRAAYIPLPGLAAPGVASVWQVVEHVPDAVGADVYVVGTAHGLFRAEDVTVTPVGEYDPSRPLGTVRFRLGEPIPGDVEHAENVSQTLLAAEALGAAEAALQMAVDYAKQRKAFGRAIGSFQAIKHQLTDGLRLAENARSLLYYAAYAAESEPSEFGLAANAARFAADQAVDACARRCLAVHGGLGATWEHEAHLYFRRAQLTRLLLGGQAGAGERVVRHVIPG